MTLADLHRKFASIQLFKTNLFLNSCFHTGHLAAYLLTSRVSLLEFRTLNAEGALLDSFLRPSPSLASIFC